MNIFDGQRLKYLIGSNGVPTQHKGYVVEVPYDCYDRPVGLSIKYCNLFDEKNTGKYGPYMHSSSTAREYDEGQISPQGEGWDRNIREQLEKALSSGFRYIELDNPDAYHLDKDIFPVIRKANEMGFGVIAKNPAICRGNKKAYIDMCEAIIVEKDCGTPEQHESIRGDKTVWFVAFEDGRDWANLTAHHIHEKGYKNMFVSYSPRGEYVSSIDII